MAILLISDGHSSETNNNGTNEIFSSVREGNRKLQNTVRIFTYGVGRTGMELSAWCINVIAMCKIPVNVTGVNMELLNALAQQYFDDENTELARDLSGEFPIESTGAHNRKLLLF